MARACAAQTNACYLKLAGPSLVQMFIGDGAKLVRDAFELAKEKAPAIIFIDELDAIGTKRFDSEKSGDREVQRTMLELLNQLDGFSSDERIKVHDFISSLLSLFPMYPHTTPQVIAATNRIDILDPALLRSGRLDRKIEFPLPNETARARILEIHSRKMAVSADVNYEELARSTDEFNGAQLKAVCVEAGMIALREGATKLSHEHFLSGIAEGEPHCYCIASLRLSPRSDPHSFALSSAEQEEEPAQLLHVVPVFLLSYSVCGFASHRNVLSFSSRIARCASASLRRRPSRSRVFKPFVGCLMALRQRTGLRPEALNVRLEMGRRPSGSNLSQRDHDGR